MNGILKKLTTFFGSRRFFYIVLGFFVFESLWFVFSAIYPMAFDEEFHVGLIKIYAHHWSPFLTDHPAGADQYGALVRDPSYLYHYLMSFPYRVISLFTSSETIQVIWMRLINVALFTTSLVLFRKVMLRAKASSAFTNVALTLFILIPIVPQLAAHVNYDNFMMLLLPIMCLFVGDILDALRERRINTCAAIALVAICLVMSLVKYAALPFMAAAVAFVLVVTYLRFKGHLSELWPATKVGFAAISRGMRITLLGLVLLSSVLFVQRYGVNLVQYKTPMPDCAQVLTEKQCSANGPWNRDHNFAESKQDTFKPDVLSFTGSWFEGMWHRLFFAVNGKKAYYINYRQLPVISYGAIVIAALGLLAALRYGKAIFKNNMYLAFLTILSLFYCLTLFGDEFEAYNRTSVVVAINGRYLLPILLLLAIPAGKGIALACRKKPQLKAVLASAAILVFLQGGGLITFIVRSDASWDWPNQGVVDVNNAARKVLAPIIIEGPKY